MKISGENGNKDFKLLSFLRGAAQSSLSVIVPEVPDYSKDILGRPSKTTWWIFSAGVGVGGWYPPFALRVFGQDDFPLRGGVRGAPLAEKTR